MELVLKPLEQDTYRSFRWFVTSEDWPSDEGLNVRIERGHGCNGRIHVDAFTVIKTNEHGEPIGARDAGFEYRGLCDGSCGNITATPHNGSGFLYPKPCCAEISMDMDTLPS